MDVLLYPLQVLKNLGPIRLLFFSVKIVEVCKKKLLSSEVAQFFLKNYIQWLYNVAAKTELALLALEPL